MRVSYAYNKYHTRMIRSTVNAITHSLVPTCTVYDVTAVSAYLVFNNLFVALIKFDDSYIFYFRNVPGQYKRHSERLLSHVRSFHWVFFAVQKWRRDRSFTFHTYDKYHMRIISYARKIKKI